MIAFWSLVTNMIKAQTIGTHGNALSVIRTYFHEILFHMVTVFPVGALHLLISHLSMHVNRDREEE